MGSDITVDDSVFDWIQEMMSMLARLLLRMTRLIVRRSITEYGGSKLRHMDSIITDLLYLYYCL